MARHVFSRLTGQRAMGIAASVALMVVVVFGFAATAMAYPYFEMTDPVAGQSIGTLRPTIEVYVDNSSMMGGDDTSITAGDIALFDGGSPVPIGASATIVSLDPLFGTQAYLVLDLASGPGLAWAKTYQVTPQVNAYPAYIDPTWTLYTDDVPAVVSYAPANSSAVTSTLLPTISVRIAEIDDAAFTGGFGVQRFFVIKRTTAAGPVTSTPTVGLAPGQVRWDSATKTFTWTAVVATDNATYDISFLAKDPDTLLPVEITNWTFYVASSWRGTFSHLSPASPVTSATVPIDVQVQADDAKFAIDPANPLNAMKLDGVSLAPSITQPVAGDSSIVRFSASSALADGDHTVVTHVADIHGLEATDTWTFTVAAPPVASGFFPTTVAADTQPTISAHVTDNGPGAPTVTMTVDGSTVASTYDPGTHVVSYTPASPLASAHTYTVELQMADAAGNTSTASWTFRVDVVNDATFSGMAPAAGSRIMMQPVGLSVSADSVTPLVPGATRLYVDGVVRTAASAQPSPGHLDIAAVAQPLSAGPHTVRVVVTDSVGHTSETSWEFTVAEIPACAECHPGVPAGHADPTPPCDDCHTPAFAAVPRHTDAQVISGHITTSAGCDECHSSSIIAEHDKYAYAGSNKCMRCHDSSNPAVLSAIASGSTNCNACHTNMSSSGHTAFHDGGEGSGDCLGCHKSNISEEHLNDCATCHDSTDSVVVGAIADHKTACGACHDPGLHPAGFFSGKTDYYTWTTTPGPRDSGPQLGEIGDNPSNPGAHANYLAATAKCGMCHSVHRAAGDGAKLLPTADATCAGCHTGGTAVTAKIVTWTPYDVSWVPEVDPASPLYPLGSAAWLAASGTDRVAAITNQSAAGGAANGGGPHNDSALDLIADGYWDGTGPTPQPTEDGTRYGCWTRSCHASNPHGSGAPAYKIFAAKMLFNEAASDLGTTYGGLDAPLDDLGAIDAAVERFVSANSSIMSTTSAGDILINGVAPDANETHALVAGLTCGRPSAVGVDECHAEAAYAIVDKGIKEQRNHATGLTRAPAGAPLRDAGYTTDNTGEELPGFGGNDNRDWKTGHVAGTFAAQSGSGSYAPIAGCTSCHDQTDAANTVEGNFTFPHGQVAAGATNITSDGVTQYTGRARVWMGYGASVGAPLLPVSVTGEKAYDGNCLKCHRDGAGNGIGLNY